MCIFVTITFRVRSTSPVTPGMGVFVKIVIDSYRLFAHDPECSRSPESATWIIVIIHLLYVYMYLYLCATPWAQEVGWVHIRRSEDVQ